MNSDETGPDAEAAPQQPQLSPAQQQRQQQALEITRNPREFKICEGCLSIVRRSTVLCPNCHSYRYDADPQRVSQQAQELGRRPAQSVQSDDLIS